MTQRVEPSGKAFQAKLPNGQIIKSENQQALEALLTFLAVGRVSKSESAFLAALCAFDDAVNGKELLARAGCPDLRSLTEALTRSSLTLFRSYSSHVVTDEESMSADGECH